MAITEYEDKIRDIVENLDKEEFIFEFLSVYSKIAKSTITKLRKGTNNLSKVPGEYHLKNKLYFKQVSGDTLQAFTDLVSKISQQNVNPRYIVVTDFKNLIARDTKTQETIDIDFKKLPRNFEFFLAWNGIEKADFERENPADLKAAERFAKLYDTLLKDNERISRHGLNLFLIRLLFCLFAEDTGVFEKDIFTNTIKSMTKEDGSDLNCRIQELFEFLDTKIRPEDTPAWLRKFPYVNGQLFTEQHTNVVFSKKSRNLIIEAGELIGWDKVNPDILGSMLQAVASEDKRSHLGMHYTSVPNIMKVIKPLFLDDLRAEFKNARGDSDRLNRLLVRMGKIKFMDPACGSGNFLIITYKELRRLEMDIYEELGKINGSMIYTSSIDLGQFYGIEIEDFAVDVTRLSLYIADHQMNLELKRRYGDYLRETLPLHKVGDIRCGNALRLNWDKILPHDKDDEVYLFGNPPYLGARDQKDYHKKDMEYIFSKKIKLFKNLDYISGWFYLATKYIYKSNAKFAFVTTNSICQGVQVGILWPKLLDEVEISFAYTPFNWGNNAKKNANVIISIIGCRNYSSDKKLLYSNDKYKIVRNISPYLAEGSNEVVIAERKPLQGLPNMLFGNMANDGGYLIFDQKRYDNLPMSVKKLTKPLIGSKEYIRGSKRYCLWLYKISDREYENNDFIMDLLKKVREHRLKSKRTATKKLAESPELFGEIRYEKSNFVFIPEVSSENREYVPMGYFSDYSVVVAPNLQIYDAPLWLLGLLESRMHMLWLKNIGGTLGTSFRYSATLVYNTFPVPELSTRRKNEIEELIGNILDIREEEGGTLAELYGSPLAAKNPKPMNPRLLEAHKELDKVVDRAYKSTDFKDDNERLALLLNMYSEMVNKKG
ncbi:DNA methylase [Ligilactobacillus salivarius]|uniref:class I SAM-dependent DNA methyltransferase n=2 Tax=Ligilactobacillus salivarius TaxID=1624 RepID=UPI000BCDF795|nr:DNA methyltransferase [Ligilactobacillus salivarius]PAY35737.1 DNA methylase [Ligilactobacillus salivarius]